MTIPHHDTSRIITGNNLLLLSTACTDYRVVNPNSFPLHSSSTRQLSAWAVQNMAFSLERFVQSSSSLSSAAADLQVPRFIHSRIFEFVVGHEKMSFKIHSSVIAEQSEILNNLINGAMIEAQVGRVVWEDLNVNTFVRFIQFAYLGDYPAPASRPMTKPTQFAAPATPLFTFFSSNPPTIPAPTIPSNPPTIPAPTISSNPPAINTLTSPLDSSRMRRTSLDDLIQLSKTKQENTPTKTKGERSFRDMDYPARIPATKFLKSCRPRFNQPSEDFTPVFIAHAELYVFAEKYQISILKQNTLHKLHKTLAIYRINPDDISAIIELIRYTFSDENTLELENHVDDLRELVTAYVNSEIKIIGNCEQFLVLLEEGGAFVKKVWLNVMKNMSKKVSEEGVPFTYP